MSVGQGSGADQGFFKRLYARITSADLNGFRTARAHVHLKEEMGPPSSISSRTEWFHETHEDTDPVEKFEDGLSDDGGRAAAREARRAAVQLELDDAIRTAGIADGAPRYIDMRLPMEYWARRSALRDAVASFLSGGLVALTGLALSTVASVWSLYLPTVG